LAGLERNTPLLSRCFCNGWRVIALFELRHPLLPSQTRLTHGGYR
jgi:hypothetical protein